MYLLQYNTELVMKIYKQPLNQFKCHALLEYAQSQHGGKNKTNSQKLISIL